MFLLSLSLKGPLPPKCLWSSMSCWMLGVRLLSPSPRVNVSPPCWSAWLRSRSMRSGYKHVKTVKVFQTLVLAFPFFFLSFLFKKRRRRRKRFSVQIRRWTFHFLFVRNYLPRKIRAWCQVQHYAFLHIKSWIFKYIKIVVLQSLVL